MAGRPTDIEQKQKIVDALKSFGGRASNRQVRERLGLSDEEYFRIRAQMIEEGTVIRYKCYGGGTQLVEVEAPSVVEVPTGSPSVQAPVETPKESDLYLPCLKVLQEKWTPDMGLESIQIEITASQGSKKTGGTWTRPDISAVSMRTFSHWPGRVYDVWTFEVKPVWQFNVTGVFEAAAHSRSATHSYVLFAVESEFNPETDDAARIVSEAQRLGVGVVFFKRPDDYDSWFFAVEPVRRQPDPSLLNEFVVTQFSAEAQTLLLKWSK